MLTLVDSSSWVEAFRANGKQDVRERVHHLISERRAAWCDPVRLELWNGRAGEQEQKRLLFFEGVIPTLPITPQVWMDCIDLAKRARIKGYTIPPIDLLVAACAFHHNVAIEHSDKHFEHLAALKEK